MKTPSEEEAAAAEAVIDKTIEIGDGMDPNEGTGVMVNLFSLKIFRELYWTMSDDIGRGRP